jgi:hypothetical protein
MIIIETLQAGSIWSEKRIMDNMIFCGDHGNISFETISVPGIGMDNVIS